MPRPRRLLLALIASATLAGVARADGPDQENEGFVARWRREGAIERRMVMAELRGELRLYKRPAPPSWSERAYKKGRLEVVEGVPVLRLEGTPEEMAEQHAHLVGLEAHALSESYLPAFVGGRRELERARARARELFWPHLTDSERSEIRVFARETGIDERDVLLSQSFTDLYRTWACSTLAAVGSGSAEGPLLARNLDFVSMGFLHEYSCVVVARPQGKKAYVSVSWPGVLGVLSAQNDSVALSVMVVHDGHGCEPGVPFELAFRRAIEQASTSAEVQKLLEGTTRTCANNLMVVDKTGDARLLEIAPRQIVVRPADAHGHVAATNHFRSDELRERRASLTYLSSRERLAAVERVCAREERTTIGGAIEALRAAAPRMNVQSMIFQPGKGELWVSLGKPPAADHPFVRLGPESLLAR
jgi:hypothetical protein